MTVRSELAIIMPFLLLSRSIKYQTIEGFGGAFTDSASFVFSKLNSTLQSQVLNMYFSEDGLRYTMARLPIGSCDFSLKNYNYDNASGDVTLTKFSVDHDKDYIIPFIHQANQTVRKWSNGTLNIVASPWSPPGWLKQNNNPYCSYLFGRFGGWTRPTAPSRGSSQSTRTTLRRPPRDRLSREQRSATLEASSSKKTKR